MELEYIKIYKYNDFKDDLDIIQIINNKNKLLMVCNINVPYI